MIGWPPFPPQLMELISGSTAAQLLTAHRLSDGHMASVAPRVSVVERERRVRTADLVAQPSDVAAVAVAAVDTFGVRSCRVGAPSSVERPLRLQAVPYFFGPLVSIWGMELRSYLGAKARTRTLSCKEKR
eukprot:Skav235614  [mRNA]  locus=scaffold358:79967:81725:+ [translate_table: standard]